jgi:hypothetical protein
MADAKIAYVTVLTGGDAYLPGVEVLGQSIRASGSNVPHVVMVTPDVGASARGALSAQGSILRDIEPIPNPSPARAHLYPRFAHVFTKLRAWDLTEYDKLVLLDADTIVVQRIDDLFERPGIAAAPDFFLPDQFNSGVMVLEPGEQTFRAMLDRLGSVPSYDGGDQGFLNEFFHDWYAMPVEHRLPIGYNVHNFIFQFLHSHQSLKAELARRVKVIHYTLQKPWLSHPTVSGGAALWWRTYFDVHPERDRAWKRRFHELEDWSFEWVVALLSR